RHLRLVDAEGGGQPLAGQVVGRAAEAAGHDQPVDADALAPDELGDRLDLVGDRGAEDDADAQLLEALAEPGGVRVGDVAGDDLVPDREDRAREHAAEYVGILARPGTYPRPARSQRSRCDPGAVPQL